MKFAFRSTDIHEIKKTLEFFGLDQEDQSNQKRLRDLENGLRPYNCVKVKIKKPLISVRVQCFCRKHTRIGLISMTQVHFTFESEEIQAIINESGANDTAKHL